MAQLILYNGQLIIPAGYEIQPNQYSGRQDITRVIVGEGATIGECAFMLCHNLTSLVIHQGATIGKDAFLGCRGLTSLVIHQGAKIGKFVFWNCSGLKSLVIPQGATIGESAFRGCTGLTSLVIPQDVTIGNDAFGNCSRLTSLFIICPEDKEAAWIAAADRIRVRADKLKFIRPAFIEAIINRIILYLPSMGGRALEYPVYPEELTQILETNQGDLTPSPSTLQQLRFNNAAVVPHHQKEEIRRIAKAVLFVMERAVAKYFLAPEMWFYILSFLFYQKLGPSRFLMLMDSLKGGFMKRLAHSGRAVLELKLDPMAGPDAGG